MHTVRTYLHPVTHSLVCSTPFHKKKINDREVTTKSHLVDYQLQAPNSMASNDSVMGFSFIYSFIHVQASGELACHVVLILVCWRLKTALGEVSGGNPLFLIAFLSLYFFLFI